MKKGWSDDEGEAKAERKQSAIREDDGLVWGEEKYVAVRGKTELLGEEKRNIGVRKNGIMGGNDWFVAELYCVDK